MSRTLNTREKRLLGACLLVIFLVGNIFAYRVFNTKRQSLKSQLTSLEEQKLTNDSWLKSAKKWEKRKGWIESHMPYTNSAGRSQGQLLEELQNTSLDAELKISGQTLLEPTEQDHYNEVAVNIKLRGDQDKMMRWLLMLQSPERFQVVKSLDLELDAKAKEKTPQAQCNLTIARWFNKEAPPGTEPPPPAAAPAATETPDPLASPLDPLAPAPVAVPSAPESKS